MLHFGSTCLIVSLGMNHWLRTLTLPWLGGGVLRENDCLRLVFYALRRAEDGRTAKAKWSYKPGGGVWRRPIEDRQCLCKPGQLPQQLPRRDLQLGLKVAVLCLVPRCVDGEPQVLASLVGSPFVYQDQHKIPAGLHESRVHLHCPAKEGFGFARAAAGG